MTDKELEIIIKKDPSQNLLKFLIKEGKEKLIDNLNNKFSYIYEVLEKSSYSVVYYLNDKKLISGEKIELKWNNNIITNHEIYFEYVYKIHEEYNNLIYRKYAIPYAMVYYNESYITILLIDCLIRRLND